jgi:hypothetical protein
MDPLSIAASAGTLVGTCLKTGTALYTFIDNSRSVDSNLKALYDEILV